MKFHGSRKAMDSRRSGRIQMRLNRLSAARRAQQIKAEQAPALKRGVKLTVRGRVPLNKNGDMRGIANRINPPSSEYMRKIRAMRRIYNKAMPKLQCSNCAFATSCPQFKAGYECAYLPFLHSHKIDSESDLLDAMKNLCEASLSRVHRQAMMETLTGGMPSIETSEAFNLAFGQLKMLHDKLTESNTVEATLETDNGTIIGRLFGSLNTLVDQTAEAHSNPINAVPVVPPSIAETALPALTEGSAASAELIKEHTRDELEHLRGKSGNQKSAIVVSQITKA